MDIVSINPFSDSTKVEQIVEVYIEAFGAEPWNEGYLCPVCKSIYPSMFKGYTCTTCQESKSISVLLVDYWPRSRVISDFYCEMEKSGSCCVIAERDNCVSGFAWGYTVNLDEQLSNHLAAPDLHTLISGAHFYLDECAIKPNLQGYGLGKKLVSEILDIQDHKSVVLRTKNGSRMCTIITHMGGRVVSNISRDRVIMLLNL